MFRPLLISMFLTSTALADTWTVDDDGKIALDTYLEVEDPHTYIFKNRQSLEYDLTRIAIQLKTADDLFWSKVNVPLGSVEPSPIKDWYLLTLSNRSHTIDGVVQATTKYAALDGVRMASPVFVDGFGGPLIPTSVILMQFNHDPSIKQVNVLLEELNAMPVTEQAWSLLPGSYKVTSCSKNGFDVIAQANALSNRSDVRFAEPDMIFTGVGDGTPNDPGFSNCWGLNNTGQSGGVVDMDMDSLESWDITTGDESILVMIIDTGVQQDHPDINQIGGMDFTSDSSTTGGPVNECDNHGTKVAGCVSAIINNNLGTVGSAPNVNSVSARCYIHVLTSDCSGGWIAEYSWTADALDWGLTIGVRVTNNSNGFGASAAVESMYEATRNAGMVHFAAAGNDASPTISYPARLTTVNAVAALDRYGQLASFSTWGNGLAISAPGVSIYTTDRTGADGSNSGDYHWGSGTSYASPYTAGVAALVLSVDPSLTAMEVENILFSSAMDLGDPGYDTTYGHGFVNANNALSLESNGACCVEIWCTQETLSGCMAIGGNYLGTGTSCGTSSCDTDGVLHVPSEYPDIQTAIIVAVDGNEILIGPGTYTGSSDEVINVMGKRLWIHSSNGPEVTIIDGEGVRRVVQCSSGETSKTIIEGLTITNGYSELDGGGMYCNGGDPTVINCTFVNNSASFSGGGMYNHSSSPTLDGCTFNNNIAANSGGGGMYNYSSSPTLTNCTFTGNYAILYGGGMRNNAGSNPSLTNCTFTNNTADYGGGMRNYSSSPTLTGCTFESNTAEYGGGMRNVTSSSPTLTGCTFTKNTANADGGGMYCNESSATLENCTFTDNISIDDGAGAYFLFSDSVLTNCVFDSNSSNDEAGGLFSDQSDLVMNYCIFTNNSGDYGGGMYCWSSNPTITNCTFTNNTASHGGGIRCKEFSNPTLENCEFEGNTANVDGGGMYNTSDSIPALVYTLVCANNPNQIVGPWTDGGGNTIADECPECPDINGDDIVDVSDLLIVIGYWGSTDAPADINGDGIVDVTDLLEVVGNWGPCE